MPSPPRPASAATTAAPVSPWAATRCAGGSDRTAPHHQRNRGRAAMLCPASRLEKLGYQLCKQVGIDIAARQNDDDVLALGVDAAGEQRGEANGAAGLDHELQLAIGEGDRSGDFL